MEMIRRALRTHSCDWVGALVCLIMLPGLTGCGVGNSVDFSSWVNRYNNNVSDVRKQQLLLNIMRASDNMPLTFTAVQVVRGNGQATSGATLGGSLSNTSVVQAGTATSFTLANALTPGANFSVTDGFGFDVSVLDTAEFYQGLRTPVSLDTFNYYLSHGIPAELLLNLLIERVSLATDGVTVTYVNTPGTPGHAAFLAAIDRFLKLGITSEIVTRRMPFGTIEAADVKDPAAIGQIAAAVKAGLVLEPVAGGYRLVQMSQFARLCVMSRDNLTPALPAAALCVASPQRTAVTGAPESIGATLAIQPRSTLGVFSYLGNIVRAETRTGQQPVAMHTAEAQSYGQAGAAQSLFRVIEGRPRADDLATIGYRGSVFSIPNDEQGHSAAVMTLLLELLSLSKSVNAVPPTGTVILSR
jgi:hypothetical protein